ncbi:glycosyltransferase family 2 protein [Natrialbaceae archaeon GCM10025810]|uniref:glycosyltransferase family 2 protein n=1 Tax=Halovalidus salilacus TaxID=3075124 RepID=UPI003615E0E7
MEGERPLVSVIIPTYDRPEMLVEAVESVVAQDYPSLELIVVDDGSSSPAEEALSGVVPDGFAFRCLRHETNRGANAARTTGIREANGDVLAFLDDDDRWKPEKIGIQVSALRDDDIGVAIVGQEFTTKHGERTTIQLPDVDPAATESLLGNAVAGPFSTIAVEASVVEETGPPDERFPAWQDREWLLRLSRHCRFESIRRPLVVRRIGRYEQIGDRFEPLRDVSYPLYVEKHRELAALYGREREFLARRAMSIACAGLANGYYADARRFALRAIRTYPPLRDAYLYLFIALIGPHAYRSASQVKRTVERSRRSIRGSIP